MAKIPSVFRDVYYSPYRQRDTRHDLYKSTKESLDFVQRLKLLQKLPVHQGCVNTICWNDTGEYILSGSDDQQLCITSGNSYKPIVSMRTRHRANIFSAKFLPNTNDRKIISCSGDGLIIYTELDRPDDSFKNCFSCHVGTAYKIVTVPNDPNTFLSCGEDGTVRWFDLRTKTHCSVEDCKEDTLINCQRPVTALAVDPIFPYQLAIGCCDSSVRIYDRRMLGTKATGNFTAQSYQGLVTKFTVPEFEGKSHRITSLVYSSDSKEVLVSYSSEYLYLFRIKGDDTKPSAAFSAGLCDRDGKKEGLAPPPPMKRLRLRGDWSDTGPNARPERELRDAGQQRSLHANLMHHVSDVLTRMINDPARQNRASNLSPRARSVVRVAREMAASEASAAAAAASSGNSAASAEAPDLISVRTIDVISLLPRPVADEDAASAETANACVPPSSGGETLAGHSRDNPSAEVPNPTAPDAATACGPSEQRGKDCGVACTEKEFSHVELRRRDVADASDEAMASAGERSPSIASDLPNETVLPRLERSSSRRDCATNSDAQMVSNSLGESSSSRDPMEESEEDQTPTRDTQMRVRKIGISGPSTWVPTTSTPVADSEEAENSDEGGDNSDTSTDSDLPEMEHVPEPQNRPRSASPFDILRSMDEAIRRQEEEREKEDKFLLHLPQPILLQKFTGHRNARTMIKEANFWGENYVMSGSDCGHVFIWNRHTAELVMIMEADHHVVNCLQPHPYDPVLATSGIDYDIKLWAPGNEEPNFEEKVAVEIMGRNEVMLEETRDTITVPASFMIRMLASFNHLRQGGIFARWRQTLRREPQPGED